MRGIFCLVVGLVGSFGLGCLWDRDTVAAELKGMPEMQNVIAGRFERNPDLYYEMRLERIRKKADKEFPGDYFDAAVALDRLGKHDEAISEIEKELDAMMARVLMTPESYRDLEYKRFANLGTFYIHRGLKKGDKGLTDLKKGLGMIEQAVEVNPEAHFGREKVQVALVQDVISRLESGSGLSEIGLTQEEVRKGVIGLMVLGNAWESTVAWEWLAGTHKPIDSHVRSMIVNRIKEIEADYEFIEELPDPLVSMGYEPQDEDRTKVIFEGLRLNGREWGENREKFMLAKLGDGLHPDTHKDFWAGYVEVPRYEIEETVPGGIIDPVEQLAQGTRLVLGACAGVVVLVVGVFVWKRVRRGQRG